MLKIIVIIVGLAAVVGGAILAYAATRPDTFRVQRALDIKAPPEKLYGILTDLRQSTQWSPYEKKDPDMKRTYGGAPTGKGATYEWDGDRNVGAGRIEIADVAPSKKVTLKLDMLRPFAASNVVDYTLEPKGDTTRVTWSMQGAMPYPAKVMSVIVDMDKMVGGDFEVGLANLKAYAER
jgi:uncharacterized protein YndB with AHSA1/START domain